MSRLFHIHRISRISSQIRSQYITSVNQITKIALWENWSNKFILEISWFNYACNICGKIQKQMQKYYGIQKTFQLKAYRIKKKVGICTRWKKVKNNGKNKVFLWENCVVFVGRNRFWYHNFYYIFKRKWKPLMIRKESSYIKEVYFMLLSLFL